MVGGGKMHHIGYCAFKPGDKLFLNFIIREITPVLGHATGLALGLGGEGISAIMYLKGI